MPLVTLDRVSIAFGHVPLLDSATLQIDKQERVAVIGRNGSGKSTLLRIISGEVAADAGTVWRQPALKIARLDQDVPLSSRRTVVEVVAEGHRPHLDDDDAWIREHQVDLVLSRLQLPGDVVVDTLSGGWRRRVLLARALVNQPDLLLLDEPTNHLDIDSIAWLEGFLVGYPGAVMFVTHDRAFLQRLATRIVELDRGALTSWPGDYATYERRKEDALANEAAERARFDRKLAEEEEWLRRGIKARRTRNEGRVRALLAMRDERARRREQPSRMRLAVERAEISGHVVFEAAGVMKSLGERVVVRDFSTRVMRRDRVGVIGPNGAGKTTLLRLLIGEVQPDSGEVTRGANVRVAYYDQQREQLNPDRSVFDTIGEGSDTITANGRTRHVNAYLRDFLFSKERARSPVRSLSGGERNRLLLARLFTRPANVLVLDEPTNDLDLETLELLEAELVEWSGTLLLVSHDRTFLNNIVTSTLVLDGSGRVQEYVGGYDDWIRQRRTEQLPDVGETHGRSELRPGDEPRGGDGSAAADRSHRTRAARSGVATRSSRLSYRQQRELEALPEKIETLEAAQRALKARIEAPEFYREPPDAIHEALARASQLDEEVTAAYTLWHELDSRRQS